MRAAQLVHATPCNRWSDTSPLEKLPVWLDSISPTRGGLPLESTGANALELFRHTPFPTFSHSKQQFTQEFLW